MNVNGRLICGENPALSLVMDIFGFGHIIAILH